MLLNVVCTLTKITMNTLQQQQIIHKRHPLFIGRHGIVSTATMSHSSGQLDPTHSVDLTQAYVFNCARPTCKKAYNLTAAMDIGRRSMSSFCSSARVTSQELILVAGKVGNDRAGNFICTKQLSRSACGALICWGIKEALGCVKTVWLLMVLFTALQDTFLFSRNICVRLEHQWSIYFCHTPRLDLDHTKHLVHCWVNLVADSIRPLLHWPDKWVSKASRHCLFLS